MIYGFDEWGTMTGRVGNPYPGSNVSEIKRLIDIAMKKICETYWNNHHTFLFSVEQSKLAKTFLLKKAAQKVAEDFPNTNGLALLEALNDLTEEMLKQC